jgi:Fur family peroxide stress response transcriptional regulator
LPRSPTSGSFAQDNSYQLIIIINLEQILNYEYIKAKLTTAGLKATHQRIVIYDMLLTLGHHPTAEEIYARIKPANPSMSLGTVYKTLEAFVTSLLIRRVLTADGLMRYDARTDAHSHIYCVNTQEIVDFTDPELHQWIEDYFRHKNIRNLKIREISVQISAEKIDPAERIVVE